MGAGFAYAFTQLDQPTFGDTVVTGALVVQDSSVLPPPTPTTPPTGCIGDCSNTNAVHITDLVLMVNLALNGETSGPSCPGVEQWCTSALGVTVDCIIVAVNNALDDCGISGLGGPCGGNLEPRECAPGLVCHYRGVVPGMPGTCVEGPAPTRTPPPCTPTPVCPGVYPALCSVGVNHCPEQCYCPIATPTKTPKTPTPTPGCVESVSPEEAHLCTEGGQACFNIAAPDTCCWQIDLTYSYAQPWWPETDHGCGSGYVCFDVPGHHLDPGFYVHSVYVVGSQYFTIGQYGPGVYGYCPDWTPTPRATPTVTPP